MPNVEPDLINREKRGQKLLLCTAPGARGVGSMNPWPSSPPPRPSLHQLSAGVSIGGVRQKAGGLEARGSHELERNLASAGC